MHFVRLANTFLKDEESAPDNHVYGGPQVPTFVHTDTTTTRQPQHTTFLVVTPHYISQCSVVSVVSVV